MGRHGGKATRPGGGSGGRGEGRSPDRDGLRGAGTLFELAFSFAGTMLAGMAIGYYGGRWLDAWWGTEPWLQLVGLMLGVVAAFRALWRTLQ
ncbi:MAG: AtpZ/AtpI family protein, partial [Symbiobacteriaceae bacterium]